MGPVVLLTWLAPRWYWCSGHTLSSKAQGNGFLNFLGSASKITHFKWQPSIQLSIIEAEVLWSNTYSCHMMHFNILFSAKKEKKNSCVDHKATEMISLFTGGSPATLWETEPWRNSYTHGSRKAHLCIVFNNNKKIFFGKNRTKGKIATLKTYPHENVSVHLWYMHTVERWK